MKDVNNMKLRFHINESNLSGYGYKYRGWPVIMPNEYDHFNPDFKFPEQLRGKHATYAITGKDILNGGGGVLEWCYSEEDAKWLFQKMKQFSKQFQDLQIKSEKDSKNVGLDYLPESLKIKNNKSFLNENLKGKTIRVKFSNEPWDYRDVIRYGAHSYSMEDNFRRTWYIWKNSKIGWLAQLENSKYDITDPFPTFLEAVKAVSQIKKYKG